MIVTLAALFLAAAAPASQPTFGIMCKSAGQLGPDNQLKQFPKIRPLGVFVTLTAKDQLQVGKTFDPTALLLGRQLSTIRPSVDGAGYFGLTSGTNPETQVLFTPGKSGQWNDWRVSIKGSDFEATKLVVVGTCMLMDGATQEDFDQLAASFGSTQ